MTEGADDHVESSRKKGGFVLLAYPPLLSGVSLYHMLLRMGICDKLESWWYYLLTPFFLIVLVSAHAERVLPVKR